MNGAASRHPDSEVLAAFVDGANLSDQAVREIADHLVECAECESVVAEAARFSRPDEQEIEFPHPTHRTRWWAIAAVAALSVFASLIAIRLSQRDPLSQLQPRSHRTTEGRLSAFPYAPFQVSRSAQGTADARQLAIAATLQEKLEKERSAGNLHRYALAQLALGNVDRGEQLLREALHADPSSAAILSDLSAAQLASGKASDAAESAGQALDHDPRFAAAAFNSALALESLTDKDTAAQAWERYLSLEPDGEWAAEARAHLARLRQRHARWSDDRKRLQPDASPIDIRRIVKQYPQRVRYFVQDELLPRWAEQGDERDLRLAETIARSRFESGDPFLLDVVAHVRDHRTESVKPLIAFGHARQLSMERRFDDAENELQTAAESLGTAGSPLTLAANVFLATNEFYLGQGQRALARLDHLEHLHTRDLERYRAVEAQVDWVRGLVLNSTGQLNESLVCFRRASERSRLAGETEDEIALNALISEVLDGIGEREEADEFRLRALRKVNESDVVPQRAYVAYYQAVNAELEAGRPHVALAFNHAQSRIAREENYALYRAESAVSRALAYRDLNEPERVRAALNDAEGSVRSFETPGLRDRIDAEIAFLRGVSLSPSNPAGAAREFGSALAIWDRYGWRLHTAAGHLRRGEALLACGDRRAAERDFFDGITDIDQQRETLEDPFLRIAYFDRAYALFDRLVTALVDDGRALEAFPVAEHKRARTLLDRVTSPRSGEAVTQSGQSVSIATVQAHLPPATAVIEYAALEDRLVMWVITRRDAVTFVDKTPASQVEASIESLIKAARTDDSPSFEREARSLFDRLIGPIALHLGAIETIVFVPDGALNRIPFACLVAPDGHYLVERAAIAIAPSAAVFAQEVSRTSHGAALLAAVDRANGYAPLPAAAKEVESIAAGWKNATVLAGDNAVVADFVRRLPAAGVVHFAGHAVEDEERPWRSALVFRDQPLDAATIARLRLAAAPTIILAACSTARGTIWRSEGVSSVAAAFLQAGARNVVATLWDIDDQASSHLFATLHERMRQTATTAAALRETQLQMLHSTDPRDRTPASWAGVVLIGSM